MRPDAPSDHRPWLRSAVWKPLRVARPPGALRGRLAAAGSLTLALEREGGPVRVHVLAHGWGRPAVDERRRLGLACGEAAWVREVCLQGGPATVFARTVIPPAARHGGLRPLVTLGSRPLGHWLFGRGAEGGVRRSPFEVAYLNRADAPLSQRLGSQGLPATGHWARRSVLRARGYPLLVTEVFMARWPRIFSGASP